MRRTLRRARPSTSAADSPAAPPPTTTTSTSFMTWSLLDWSRIDNELAIPHSPVQSRGAVRRCDRHGDEVAIASFGMGDGPRGHEFPRLGNDQYLEHAFDLRGQVADREGIGGLGEPVRGQLF